MFSLTFLVAASAVFSGFQNVFGIYHEPHRNQFHYSPQISWMNDPNGMVFYNGTYHLFYQYTPEKPSFGMMHWGHARSTDLVHWEEQQPAIAPDENGLIFSGSAVVDFNNTSGFGTVDNPPLVSIFTYALTEPGLPAPQSQALAYSVDDGVTWTKYSGNPVLTTPGPGDFRDPKVFWHEPTRKWIMSLAVNDSIYFYSSGNLKNWTKESDFGQNVGAHGGVWECPDVISFQHEGQTLWILFVSINPGAPNLGSGTQYFVGDFDGKTFTPKNVVEKWLDWGPDNYAGVTWSNVGDRKLFIAWMNNWLYGGDVPTSPWRGAMTVPRDLSLREVGNDFHLISQPVPELDQLVRKQILLTDISVSGQMDLSPHTAQFAGRFRLSVSFPSAADWNLILHNNMSEEVVIGYQNSTNKFFIDRSNSGNVAFNQDFGRVAWAPRNSIDSRMQFTVLVDVASVELFGDGGLTCMTATFFPSRVLTGLKLRTPTRLPASRLEVAGMHSIWN